MKTPRDAIVADITRSPGIGTPGSSAGAMVYRGGHRFQARPDSIRFLKERVVGDRALLAVEFEDTEARPWQYVFGAAQKTDGTWKAAGGAGGGGGQEPRSARPWVNFGGWGWPRFLCLGGRVYGEGVAQVRLIDAQGRTLQDSVDEGIALLLSNDQVDLPCQIELCNAAGVVLAIQSWPPEPGARPP